MTIKSRESLPTVATYTQWVSEPVRKARVRTIPTYEPLLAEVDMLNTTEGLIIDEQYLFANELTTLVEGIQGSVSQYTSEWDEGMGDFSVGGKPLSDIFNAGIALIAGRLERSDSTMSNRVVLENELRRRICERNEHESFISRVINGTADSSVQVTISPFPEEVDTVDPQETRKLGYGKDRTWKVRASWFDKKTNKKTTAEFFAQNSNLSELKYFAESYLDMDTSAVHTTTDFLAQPQWLSTREFPTWYNLLQHIAPVLYQQDAQGVVDESISIIQAATSLAERLVVLDKELAISLKSGRPSSAIQKLLSDYRSLSQIEQHSPARFTRALAARIKELELITNLTELAIKTGKTESLRGMDTYHTNQDPDQSKLRALIAQNPIEFSVCGSTIASGSVYSWNTDSVKLMLFGSEKRVVTCPLCQQDNTLDKNHIFHGIACWSCGERVPSGEASECIVLTARTAGVQHKNTPRALHYDEVVGEVSIELPMLAEG